MVETANEAHAISFFILIGPPDVLSLCYRELESLITCPAFVAFILVHGFAVLSETSLSFVAPEEAVVTVWDGWVPHGINEHSLPAQMSAAVFVDSG